MSNSANDLRVETYRKQVRQAAERIRQDLSTIPDIGIILGTGLGQLADTIDVEHAFSYEDLPHFPLSTVEMHSGKLLVGQLSDVSVLTMQGRFHLYEGYSPREVTFPVRVMGELGVKTLLISNAAGGMNPHFSCSDVVLITDHINFQGANPLTGPNVDEWGPRFPDMSMPYDKELQEVARQCALERRVPLQEGVYVAVEGPNLETRAEYRMLRDLGGDLVGMSTVPEVIVARHMNMRVLAFSVVTDECFPDALEPVDVEDIVQAAAEAEPTLTRLVMDVISKIGMPNKVRSQKIAF